MWAQGGREGGCPITHPFPPVSGDALQLMAELLRIFVIGEPRALAAPVDKLRGFSQLLPTLGPVPEKLTQEPSRPPLRAHSRCRGGLIRAGLKLPCFSQLTSVFLQKLLSVGCGRPSQRT